MSLYKTPITLTSSTIIVAAAIFAQQHSQAASDERAAVEPCYGIVKAGKNDCYANGHSCPGEAKTGSDPYEWLYLPVGLCERISGGSLTPGKAVASKTTANKPKQP